MDTATIERDEALSLIRATLDVSNVEDVQVVQIHDGDIGRNGDVACGFEAGSADTYSIAETSVSSELIDDLLDGELRGQIQ